MGLRRLGRYAVRRRLAAVLHGPDRHRDARRVVPCLVRRRECARKQLLSAGRDAGHDHLVAGAGAGAALELDPGAGACALATLLSPGGRRVRVSGDHVREETGHRPTSTSVGSGGGLWPESRLEESGCVNRAVEAGTSASERALKVRSVIQILYGSEEMCEESWELVYYTALTDQY